MRHKYRALVSITFDSEDLKEVTDISGSVDPIEAVSSELEGLSLGTAFVEQVYEDGEELIYQPAGGIMVEISDHCLDGSDGSRYDDED